MKGKIDASGNLHVERAGKIKPQVCPTGLDANLIPAYCGDWCPLFGEASKEGEQGKVTLTEEELKLLSMRIRENPSLSVFFQNEGIKIKKGETKLTLCHKTLVFDEFTDERSTCN